MRARIPEPCRKIDVVSESEKRASGLRVMALSGLSAFAAPLVFVAIIAIRKAERRTRVYFRSWNKRLQHEIARWT